MRGHVRDPHDPSKFMDSLIHGVLASDVSAIDDTSSVDGGSRSADEGSGPAGAANNNDEIENRI